MSKIAAGLRNLMWDCWRNRTAYLFVAPFLLVFLIFIILPVIMAGLPLKPGTSALFLVIDQVTPDKAIAALQQYGGTVIRTSLSDEDTKKLQEALQPPTPEQAGATS